MNPPVDDTAEIRRFVAATVIDQARQFGLGQEDIDKLGCDRSLVDAGILDSLGFVELLAAIEEKYGVEVDLFSYDPEFFTSLDGLVAIVSESRRRPMSAAGGAEEDQDVHTIRQLVYEEMTPAHPRWSRLAVLFTDMYRYFMDRGLMLPLVENGGEIWLRSLEASLGKANYVIGCLHDDQLVAFMHSAVKVLPTYFEGRVVGIIANVYVIPAYRRMGIASALLHRSEAWLDSKQVSSIELQVLAGNESAITFWHKVGFATELLQMRKKR